MTSYDMRWAKEKKYVKFEESGKMIITDDAPEEVKESYAIYLQQVLAQIERQKNFVI